MIDVRNTIFMVNPTTKYYAFLRFVGIVSACIHIFDIGLQKGMKSKIGRDFSQASIHEILCNEKYIGTYIFNRSASKLNGKRNHHASKDSSKIIKIPNGIPAVIDEQVFMKIQERMSKRKMNARNKAKEVYLLSGKVFCGKCGAAMTGHTTYSGKCKTKYSAYACGERYRTKKCDLNFVRKALCEDIVIKDLQDKLFNPTTINHLADKLMTHYSKMQHEEQKDLKIFEHKLLGVNSKINNITEAIANGIPFHSLKEKLTNLENEKAKVSSMIYEIQIKEISKALDKDMIVAYLEKDMQVLNNKSLDDISKIIQAFVEKVIVHEDNIEVFLVVHLNGGADGI